MTATEKDSKIPPLLVEIPEPAPNNAGKEMQRSGGAQFWNGPIKIEGQNLIDQYGRTIMVRGVNLTGSSKMPTKPELASEQGTREFYDHANITFVGRPFTTEDAYEHFQRLSKWGLTFCRLLVPWEALEHKGPGIYDDAYIDSLIKIIRIASGYGIKLFIDPHQDTWSRFTGGSGAPGWTLEVVGFDMKNFEATGAVHFHDFDSLEMSTKMIWPTNYTKLASATMFTVFFAGNDFAPSTVYRGMTCQDFLQSHYVACYTHLMKRLKNETAVVGIEAMNEPHYGFIGEDLRVIDANKELRLGNAPTFLQCFAMGSGHTCSVDYYVRSWPWPTRRSHSITLNKEKLSAWLPGKVCIWKKEGIWDDSKGYPELLKPTHFKFRPDGSPASFKDHYYAPFLKKFSDGVRQGNPDAIFFFEPVPNDDPSTLVKYFDVPKEFPNLIYAPHWYDLASVFSKSFSGYLTHDVRSLSRGTKNIFQASYFGLSGARRNYASQIESIKSAGHSNVGKVPCLVGECGIPMDINERKAFASGNYVHHTNFLDAVISAMESNLVHFTLWNYNPHNNHDEGDYWNGEDFSIFSTTESVQTQQRARPSGGNPSQVIIGSAAVDKEGNSLTQRRNRHSLRHGLGPLLNRLSPGTENDVSPSYAQLHSPCRVFDLSEEYFDDENGDHHVGGRALDAVIRPYAAKVCGTPLSSVFLLHQLAYELIFVTRKGVKRNPNKLSLSNISEIFVPDYHLGQGDPLILVSDGTFTYDMQKETIYWKIDPEEITPDTVSSKITWLSSNQLVKDALKSTNYNFHTLQIFYNASIRKSLTQSRWAVSQYKSWFSMCSII